MGKISKEYIVLVVLIIVSLITLSLNPKTPLQKKLNHFALEVSPHLLQLFPMFLTLRGLKAKMRNCVSSCRINAAR